MFDDFYPPSQTVADCHRTLVGLSLIFKVREHLADARHGDRKAESKLTNRIGQLRRHHPRLKVLPEDLQDAIRDGVAFLRSKGRAVALEDSDPRKWITKRDGSPRW